MGSSSSPSPSHVDLQALLDEHDGDAHKALTSLVNRHNVLIDAHSRITNENNKLWNWCAVLKTQSNVRQRQPTSSSSSTSTAMSIAGLNSSSNNNNSNNNTIINNHGNSNIINSNDSSTTANSSSSNGLSVTTTDSTSTSRSPSASSSSSTNIGRQHSLRKASSLDLGKTSKHEEINPVNKSMDDSSATTTITNNNNNNNQPMPPPTTTTISTSSETPRPISPSTTPKQSQSQSQSQSQQQQQQQPTTTSSSPSSSVTTPVPTRPFVLTSPAALSGGQNGNGNNNTSPSSSSMPPMSPSTAPQGRRPRLVPALLPFLSVRVVDSTIRPNERGKDVISFTISLVLDPSPETNQTRATWSLEKKYSDVLALDAQVKSKHSRSQAKKIADLPDKSLFRDHAPNRVDIRKQVLQSYLQSLAHVPLSDKTEICLFFNSNVIHPNNTPVTNPSNKQGYLTKRGRNFGGWQVRYYVLQGPQLVYYENPGSSVSGKIDLIGAQIGRQQSRNDNQTSNSTNGSQSLDEYRHAFLIREAKKDSKGHTTGEEVDHILCAQSDSDRDEWVRVLCSWVTGEYSDAGIAPSPTANPQSQPQQQQQSPLKKIPSNNANSKDNNGSSNNSGSTTTTTTKETAKPTSIPQHLNTSSELPISTSLPVNLNNSLLPPNSPASSVSSNRSQLPYSFTRLHPSGNNSSPDLTSDPPRSQSELGHYRDNGIGPGDENLSDTGPARHNSNGPHPVVHGAISSKDGARKRQYSADAANFVGPTDSTSSSSHRPNNPQQQQQQQQQQHKQQQHSYPHHLHQHIGQKSSTSSSTRMASPQLSSASTNHQHQSSSQPIISGPMNAVPITSSSNFKKDQSENSNEKDKEHHHNHKEKEKDSKKSHSNSSRAAKTKSSFWNFAARTDKDKRDPAGSSAYTPKQNPVFGVPLTDAVAAARIRDGFELPAVVYRCIEYLEAKECQMEEGIYRLSGSSNVIKSLKERFNLEGDVNLLGSNEYYDPHAISGLLKSFLRELPVHILTRELQQSFMQVIDLKQRHDRVNELGSLIAQLPIANYTLLRFLTAHLIHIVQNERYNKMSLRNVAIVFSPTLALPAPLFNLLMTEFDALFAMEEDTPAPVRLEADAPASTTFTDPSAPQQQALPNQMRHPSQQKQQQHQQQQQQQQPPTIVQPSSQLRDQTDQIDMSQRRKSRNSMLYTEIGADKLLESTGHRLERQTEDDEDSDLDPNATDGVDGDDDVRDFVSNRSSTYALINGSEPDLPHQFDNQQTPSMSPNLPNYYPSYPPPPRSPNQYPTHMNNNNNPSSLSPSLTLQSLPSFAEPGQSSSGSSNLRSRSQSSLPLSAASDPITGSSGYESSTDMKAGSASLLVPGAPPLPPSLAPHPQTPSLTGKNLNWRSDPSSPRVSSPGSGGSHSFYAQQQQPPIPPPPASPNAKANYSQGLPTSPRPQANATRVHD